MFKAGFKAGHGAGSNGEFDNESGTVASTEPNTGPNTVRWTAAALLATAGALVLALSIGGGAPEPSPPGIPDPGLLTGWGLPFSKVTADIAGIVTVGLLVTAVFFLPGSSDDVQGLSARAVHASRWTAGLWAVAVVVLYAFTVSDTFGSPVHQLGTSQLGGFMFNVDAGRALAVQAVVAAAIAIAARWTVRVRTAAILAGLALACFIPQALTGHAAGAGSHMLAIWTMVGHILGVSLWVGGLAGLGWVAVRGSKRLGAGAHRFSTMAAWCLVIVGTSGVLNALVRMRSLSDVMSGYGLLVVGKAVAFAILGLIGWRHRRSTLPRLSSELDSSEPDAARAVAVKGFAKLAAVELIIMAMTASLAVALSRTPTPVPDDRYEGRAAELLGRPLPDAPTVWRMLTSWTTDGLGMLIVALGVALYIKGLLVLRRRGDHWPVSRSIAWFVGMALTAWATFGGLGRYAGVLFSAHMGSHIILMMIAPIFLVLAAPITLALRTMPGPRRRGEIGPRQLLLSLLHSRVSRVLTFAPVAAVIWVGSLYVLYFSDLFTYLMMHHPGHSFMMLHFLLAGCLFFYVIIGVDPSPHRLSHLWRLATLMGAIPFHAFFAVSLMSAKHLVGKPYWDFIDRPYNLNMHADQFLGAGLTWAVGEVPMVIVIGVLFVQWFRSDRREAARFDRNEDNSEDARLAEYNAYLAALSRHDRETGEQRETNDDYSMPR